MLGCCLDQLGDILRAFGTLHGDGAIADKAGNAAHAHLHEEVGFAGDCVFVCLALEQVGNNAAVEANAFANVGQDLLVANVAVILEISFKQSLFGV